MATFWERAASKGDGELAPLQIDVLRPHLVLWAAGTIDATALATYLGLDEPQALELAELLDVAPELDTIPWAAHVVAVFEGSRLMDSELDSVDKVKAALGVTP